MSMTNERKLLLKCVTDPKALQSQWGQTIFENEIEIKIKFEIIFILLTFYKKFSIAFNYISTENLR